MQPKSNSQLFQVSLLRSLSQKNELARYLFDKHKINLQDDWTSTSNLISFLHHVEEGIGKSTIKRIGVNIAYSANQPQHKPVPFDGFIKDNLNLLYEQNHQSLSDGFKITRDGQNYYVELRNNPYPILFNIGLLSGFSLTHHSLNKIYEVEKGVVKIEKVI